MKTGKSRPSFFTKAVSQNPSPPAPLPASGARGEGFGIGSKGSAGCRLWLAAAVIFLGAASARAAEIRHPVVDAVKRVLPATVGIEWRSVDSESARRTEVFYLRYSKAEVVAEAVKEVYRDLLSDLSIGVDAALNSVVVSAPASLFPDIERLIQDLDKAPEPSAETAEKSFKGKKTISGPVVLALAHASQKQPDAVSLATGTVVSADGLIVTWFAQTKEGSYSVTFNDGRTMPARLLVDDRRSGLNLLKVDAKDLPHLSIADRQAQLGQSVLSVVSLDLKGRAVGTGILSAKERSIPGLVCEMLQTDIAVGAMSAGAPLADLQGNLLGIIAAKAGPEAYQPAITFAVPASYVKSLLECRQGESTVVVHRGLMGVVLASPSEAGAPPSAKKVTPDSAAAAAGIREGDQIVAIDGQAVSEVLDVVRLIGRHKAGEEVTVTVRREDGEKQLQVTLGRRPDELQTAASSSPKIEAIRPESLKIHTLEPGGSIYFWEPDGRKLRVVEQPDGRKFKASELPPTPQDPNGTARAVEKAIEWLSKAQKGTPSIRYGDVYSAAPATIQVQRSDLEKKLDQVETTVQTLQDQLEKLIEEVQKLREQLKDKPAPKG